MTIEPFAKQIEAGRAAQRKWTLTTMRERLRCVRRFRHLLAGRADELTAAVEADVGRLPGEVLGSDILPLAAACQFLEKSAGKLLAPRRVGGPPLFLFGQRDVVHRRPLGVVGIIGTWNYPVFLNGVQIMQAVVAGNGVVWKPSEHAVENSLWLMRLFSEAGYPTDLIQLVNADRESGARLLESDVDHIVFTGSAAVGRKIALRCAERLIPCTLELSGIDAMFVNYDADLHLAAKAAWFGVALNRGQTCLAVRRIFVKRSVLPDFMAKFRPYVESASPMPLVMAAQVDHAQNLIIDALARGGEILKPTTKASVDSRTMVPHIIVNARPDFAICMQECFAPVAAVLSFDSWDDAWKQDEQCGFALGASIFTSDMKQAQEFAARLRTGNVSINDVIAPTAHPATPFGGTGQSGWGVTQGADGLVAMTRPQVVSSRGGSFRPHFDGVSPPLEQSLHGMLAWSHGARLGQRWKGLWQMVSGFRRVGGEKKNAGV